MFLRFYTSEPGIKDVDTLNKLFNKVDFPARISENLEVLIQNNLVIVSANFDNRIPKNYKITEIGKIFLKCNFNHSEIIKYIKEIEKPKLISEITEAFINKKMAVKSCLKPN